MEILRRNLSRWITAPTSSGGHGVTNVLLLGILLEFLPYGSGQQGSSPAPNDNEPRPNSPIEVVILAMFIMFFVMALSSMLCRRYAHQPPPVTTGDVARGGSGVWVRRAARGLDARAIESFPAFLYSDVKGLKIGKGGVECAVCLSEFQDEETLRLMPPCSHVFHAECIDVWLSSHTTCPVCRASLYSKPGESFPSPVVDLNAIADPGMDLETGNAGRRNLEPSDVRLIDSVTWRNSNRTRRSRSTGLSSWRITGILFPRSHSTGHSPLQQTGENLDRFTLQLPGEARRQLMKTSTLIRARSGNVALPQARSSRRGYRSGSVGSVRNGFSASRQHARRAISLSFSFSFRNGSVRSSSSGVDPVEAAVAPPKGLLRSIKSPFEKAFKAKDGETGERSFERLRPDGRVSTGQ